MKQSRGRLMWLTAGALVGALAALLWAGRPHQALANSDRYEDYILATGAVATNVHVPTDGVWMLDYRAGKLLGTVIDRNLGKIVGWAEVDLVSEFGLPPRKDVHFIMTTGMIAQGQAALYVAETTYETTPVQLDADTALPRGHRRRCVSEVFVAQPASSRRRA